ncbi:DNA repair protein RadC [Treponema sp. OMZ 840]|uniref:RadC family protein n=1 Tax=Treponema sp. OMZ 840 TaxID=244313 RepID=UPI003D91FEAC
MDELAYSLSELTLKSGTKPAARELLLTSGVQSLSTQELIMVLLGCGTQNIPVRQLSGKVLHIVQTATEENLAEKLLHTHGIGKSKACIISAAIELGKRLNVAQGIKILHPTDVVPLLQHYTLEKQEHFLCVSLNGAQEVMHIRTISVGILNQTLIHPREVFADPLKERAAAIILSHNHPSGNADPSDKDIDITKRLLKVSEIIGIHLLDHIIISTADYFSFAENGLVFQR